MPSRSSAPPPLLFWSSVLLYQYFPLPFTPFFSPCPNPSLSLSLSSTRAKAKLKSLFNQIARGGEMDMYGLSSQELFRIDDLLDLSNEELFSSSTSSSTTSTNPDQFPPPETPFSQVSSTAFNPSLSTDFTHELCVPSDDVAELEWLSQFVDDSFNDFPSNSLAGTLTVRSDAAFSSKARSKRSKAGTTLQKTTNAWTSMSETEAPVIGRPKAKRETQRPPSSAEDGVVRRCTHCASEKTPQWRTGPLGPKTLCNACGVRYKSGRLVPEYRPAASPTFVLTQHSNSHRKVMELRRQKEMLRQQQVQQQQQQQEQLYRHHHDFQVC